MQTLDACPLCRSVLAERTESCPSCGSDLRPYYDLARLTGQYSALARELISRGETAAAREIVGRLPQLSGIEESELAELEARLALLEGRYSDAAAAAGRCGPAAAELLLAETALFMQRQRVARESYNYALTEARTGAYGVAADYLARAVEADPHDPAIWALKLKVDLKSQRLPECYRDLAALDRLGARPAHYARLEALLPPLAG